MIIRATRGLRIVRTISVGRVIGRLIRTDFIIAESMNHELIAVALTRARSECASTRDLR